MAIISPAIYFSEVALKVAKEVADFTPQLFYVKRNTRLPPYAHASSILLTVSNRFYLITAAHSFYDENVDDIGIMRGNIFCKLGGTLINFEPNREGDYEPNNFDIAVFELHPDTVAFIETQYKFLPWSKIAFEHSSSKDIRYLVFGYPIEETSKYFPTKTVIASTFTLASRGFDRDFYLSEKIDANKVVMLDILQNQIEQTISLPELEGISGCGVWIVFDVFSEFPQYKLVSIITGGNHEGTRLYSCRVEILKLILNKGFDLYDL